MEYGIYLAIVMALVAMCVIEIRRVSAASRAARMGSQPKCEAEVMSPENAREHLQRDIRGIPTPWGWPGSEHAPAGHHGYDGHKTDPGNSSGALHRWVDHLISEKQTTDDREYQRRREASMRALLEDRFHNSDHANVVTVTAAAQPGSVERKNGFSSGRLEKIDAKLHTHAPVGRAEDKTGGRIVFATVADVRTPWGW